MKVFEEFAFSATACRQELGELKELLEGADEQGERNTILPFFRGRRHLSAFIGSYFPYLANPDRIAFEYDLFGDFRSDLVVGDSESQQFCFAEFEDATTSSLFVQTGSKATLEWSERFEHGFSQVLDWLWKLSDMEGTTEFEHRFGGSASYEGMLIIGRRAGLELKERKRLKWRREKVVVDSKHVPCVTYDELYEHLDSKLRIYEAASQVED